VNLAPLLVRDAFSKGSPMLDDAMRQRPNSRDSGAPTRRRFLGAAGIAAAGAALGADPSKASAAQGTPHTKTPRATCVAVTADITKVLTCDDSGSTFLWDISVPNKPKKILPNFEKKVGKKASYVSVSKQSSSADQVVLTAGFDGRVSVHNLQTGLSKGIFTDHADNGGSNTQVWVAVVSSNGQYAISGTNGGEIRLWNPNDPTGGSIIPDSPATDEPVASLAFVSLTAPVSFLAGYGDGKMQMWTHDDTLGKLVAGKLYDHETAVTVNSIAVNGNTAVTGSFDSNVRFWDINAGTQKFPPIKDHKHFVWRVAISPLGGFYAAVGEDGKLMVRDLAQRNEKPTSHQPVNGIMGVDFIDETHLVVTRDRIHPFKGEIEILSI
jgi:WD40 repeat protein